MLLSIVVPIYNVEQYIEKCIKSLICQDLESGLYEIILVNDGSQDNSIEKINDLICNFQNIKLINQENAGLSQARNKGMNLAQGKYIWFIDSDDWLPFGTLNYVLDFISKTDSEVFNIEYENSNGESNPYKNFAVPFHLYGGFEYLNMMLVSNPVQYYIYNLSFLKRECLNFFPGIYHEDCLFTPLCLIKAKSVCYIDRVCYIYNIREGSIMTSGNVKKHIEDMFVVVEQLIFIADGLNKKEKVIFGKYISNAIGSLFYYARKMPALDKGRVLSSVDLIKLIKYPVLSGKYKYIFAACYVKFFGLIGKLL